MKRKLEKSRKNLKPLVELRFVLAEEDMEDGIGEDGVGVEGGETKKLSEAVKECVSRWFQETLNEAKAGDIRKQVLVSQMYFNGYGVSKDPHKGKFWMKEASKYLPPPVQDVSEKRPGYGASDSDST